MNIDWYYFKQLIDQKSLSIQYVEDSDFYNLKAVESGTILASCNLNKALQLEDTSDFEANYKTNGNSVLNSEIVITDGLGAKANQLDTDGAQIVRIKAAKRGWTYSATACEFVLGMPGS